MALTRGRECYEIPELQKSKSASFEAFARLDSGSQENPLTPPMMPHHPADDDIHPSPSASPAVHLVGERAPVLAAGQGGSGKLGNAVTRFASQFFGSEEGGSVVEHGVDPRRASDAAGAAATTASPSATSSSRPAVSLGRGGEEELRRELMAEARRRVAAERLAEELKMELNLVTRKVREEAYRQAVKFVEAEYIALAEPTMKLEERARSAERARAEAEQRAERAESVLRLAETKLKRAAHLLGQKGDVEELERRLEESERRAGEAAEGLAERLRHEGELEMRAEAARREVGEAERRANEADKKRDEAVQRMLAAVEEGNEARGRAGLAEREWDEERAGRVAECSELAGLLRDAMVQIEFLKSRATPPPTPASPMLEARCSSKRGAGKGGGERGVEVEVCTSCGGEGCVEGGDGRVLCLSCSEQGGEGQGGQRGAEIMVEEERARAAVGRFLSPKTSTPKSSAPRPKPGALNPRPQTPPAAGEPTCPGRQAGKAPYGAAVTRRCREKPGGI